MTKAVAKTTGKAAQREATRAQILAVAERLFAASGFDGVSVRKIAAESGIDLSLILYHFQTKEGLYEAVFERSARAILQRRHAHIEKTFDQVPGLTASQVLLAFCEPWVEQFKSKDNDIATVFARSLLDHSERQVALVKEVIDPEAKFFIKLLRQAAPTAPLAEIHRCYHLFAGALVYFIIENARIARLSGRAVADVKKTMTLFAEMIEQRLELASERANSGRSGRMKS